MKVCWNLSTLSWVVGWFGFPFFWVMWESAELGFEGVAAALAADAGEADGEDHAVVGQCRGGIPRFDGLAELGQDHWCGHPGVGGDADCVAGAVIQPGQDLDVDPGVRR